MTYTIETGLRIPEDISLGYEYLTSARHHGVSHIQISLKGKHDLEALLAKIRKEFDERVEFSFHSKWAYYSSGYSATHASDIIAEAKRLGVKYVVISDHPYFNPDSDSNQDTSLEVTEALIKEAESQHIFLCFELTIGRHSIKHDMLRMSALKDQYPSHFLLYSLHVNNLNTVDKVELYTRQMRAWLATVSVLLNPDQILQSPHHQGFAKLIEHLYWLPFKQQPLIFVSLGSDLDTVFATFANIVDAGGYQYT